MFSLNILARFRSFILFIGLISLLAILAQLIFQSILLANKPYGHTIGNCTYEKRIHADSFDFFHRYRTYASSSIFRSGTVSEFRLPLRLTIVKIFSSLDNSNALRILRLIFPDIIIFAASTICFVIIRRLLIQSRRRQRTENETSDPNNASPSLSTSTTSQTRRRNIWLRIVSVIRRIRLFIQFVILGCAAFIYPSIINSIYFIFFLIIAFVWSLSIKFGRKFTLIRALLVIYAGIHLLILYLYQFTFFQDAFQPLSLLSK